MMRLSNGVLDATKAAGVEVYFADRTTTKVWNKARHTGEPLQYGGWYWVQKKGRLIVSTDTEGPFRSESAAVRDAYVKLQLRRKSP